MISCSASNGLLASSDMASQRASSKTEKAKFTLRNISTSHWCTKLEGTTINTRWALAVNNCWWIINAASMVFPRPTSSASNTLGAWRLPTSDAMCNWWGIRSTLAPTKPSNGEMLCSNWCNRHCSRKSNHLGSSNWPFSNRCSGWLSWKWWSMKVSFRTTPSLLSTRCPI